MGKHSIITPAMVVARIEAEVREEAQFNADLDAHLDGLASRYAQEEEDKRIADEKANEEFWKLWDMG